MNTRWNRRRGGEAGHRLLAVLGALAVFSVTMAGLDQLRRSEQPGGSAGGGAYDVPVSTAWRTADGAIAVEAGAGRAPVLEIFTGYHCPACADVQDASGSTIKRLASQGRVRVVYRPVVLGHAGPAAPQRRSANASLCAPAGRWLAYHEALLGREHPATTADLVTLARRTGITDPSFAPCVNGGLQNDRLDRLTRYATGTRGVQELPAAFLNGTPLDPSTRLLRPAGLERAIHAAAPG